MASDIGIGDAVEVLFVRLDDSIGVAFADGERLAVEQGGWRRPGESGHGGGEDG